MYVFGTLFEMLGCLVLVNGWGNLPEFGEIVRIYVAATIYVLYIWMYIGVTVMRIPSLAKS